MIKKVLVALALAGFAGGASAAETGRGGGSPLVNVPFKSVFCSGQITDQVKAPIYVKILADQLSYTSVRVDFGQFYMLAGYSSPAYTDTLLGDVNSVEGPEEALVLRGSFGFVLKLDMTTGKGLASGPIKLDMYTAASGFSQVTDFPVDCHIKK